MEIILIVVIVVLCVLLYLQNQLHSKQVNELIKGIIAKNSREFVDMKFADKSVPDEPVLSDEIPMNEITNEKFLEIISKE